MRRNFQPSNPYGDVQAGVFPSMQQAMSLTLDLSLTVRMCCLPEESSAFSLSVWNSVSMKSSLKMEARNTINQHPFTEKGTHNSVN